MSNYVVVTEADVLYQMLRKVNESFLKSGERAAEFLTDKLKIKIAVLNRALNNDDKKTLCSRREDHPEWFFGLETNSPTKVGCICIIYYKMNFSRIYIN